MGNYGDPITQPLPTVGVTAGPSYADQVNAILTEMKARLEADVTPTSMSIDSVLSFGNFEVSNVGAAGMQNRGSAPIGTNKLFLLNGEFYVLDGAGRSVQVTSGGFLNAAAVAGIGGDYGGADPALVSYNAANSVFIFTQDPGVAADIDVGDVKVRQKAGGKFATTLKPSAALAGNENRFLAPNPATGPRLLLLDASGQESTTLTPVVTSLSATSVVSGTVAGTTSVQTGQADVLHGQRVVALPPSAGMPGNNGSVTHGAELVGAGGTAPYYWRGNAASARVVFPLPLAAGDRFNAVSVNIEDTANAVVMTVWRVGFSGAGPSNRIQVGATQTSAASSTFQQLTVTVNYQLATGESLEVDVEFGAANFSTQRVYGARVTFDRV